MLARHLRISLALQIALATALWWWLLHPAVPWAIALAFVLGASTPILLTACALAIEILTGALVDRRSPPAGVVTLLRVWWEETRISTLAFAWRQPFGGKYADPDVRFDPARPAVLLIHGYACNRAVWRPMLDAGVLAGCNVATIDLEPPTASIDRYVQPLASAITSLQQRSGARRVILICHSMGGLAARAYLRDHGDGAVRRIITIATPHGGTIFGYLGFGTNAHQMTNDSPYVRSLQAVLPTAHRDLFLCLFSVDDNLIVPRANLRLAHARHVQFDAVGHLAMIEDRRVWRTITEEVSTPHPGRQAAESQPV